MSNETNTNDASRSPKPTLDPDKSRVERAGDLLDLTMNRVAKQIKDGTVSSSMLKEILQLCRSAGVEFAGDGVPFSSSGDAVLDSLADIDESIWKQ